MVKVNWAHEPLPDREYERNPRMENYLRLFPFPNLFHLDDKVSGLATRMAYKLQEAIDFIDDKVKIHSPCNEKFRRLPGRKSFRELWEHPDLTIHYNGFTPNYGFARPQSMAIALGNASFLLGASSVGASIVHEIAHLNGAEGDPRKHDDSAEQTLKSCLFVQQFKPDTFGVLDRRFGRDDDEYVV